MKTVLIIILNCRANGVIADGVSGEVENYDESAWMKTIDVDFHGLFRGSMAVINGLTDNVS
ncbi:MAG: hypothetical protein ACOCQI_01790 [Desulfosalsimonas sp.]